MTYPTADLIPLDAPVLADGIPGTLYARLRDANGVTYQIIFDEPTKLGLHEILQTRGEFDASQVEELLDCAICGHNFVAGDLDENEMCDLCANEAPCQECDGTGTVWILTNDDEVEQNCQACNDVANYQEMEN